MNFLRRCWYQFQMVRHGLTDYDAQRIASKEWLSTPEHKRWAVDVKAASNRHCVLCGRGVGDLNEDGSHVILNSDHIIPRKAAPWKALDVRNGQVLCDFCNHGKGNRHRADWRHKDHPHRI